MVIGLLSSGWIALNEWTPYVIGRSLVAQSVERRFKRWLSNPWVDVLRLYAALPRGALADLPERRLWVVLDTTVLEPLLRGAAFAGVPRPGDSVGVEGLSPSKRQPSRSGIIAACWGLRRGCYGVTLLADRGFLHGELIRWINGTVDWHACIRCKRDIGLFERTRHGYRALTLRLSAGEVCYYHNVYATTEHQPVHVAVGWEKGAKEPWIIVSDQPTDTETLYAYGRRFTIEEGFLDHKPTVSNRNPRSYGMLRGLQRLCFVMAVATLVLVCQAWRSSRRASGALSIRIGWSWICRACARGEALIGSLRLLTLHDPDPARASKRQVGRSRWMDDLPCRYIFLFSAPSRG